MSALTDYITQRAGPQNNSYGGLFNNSTNYGGLFNTTPANTPLNQKPATQPTASVSSMVPSATAPVAKKQAVVASPAAQQYMGSLSQPTTPTSAPAPDVTAINAARNLAVNSGQNPYTGAGATALSSGAGLGGAATDSASTAPANPFSEYASYLKSLQGPATSAAQRLADIQNQEEKLTLDTRRAADNELNNTPGRYQSANVDASNLVSKNASSKMADLALEESAAGRSALVAQGALAGAKPLQIGDNYYDPSTGKLLSTGKQAGFSLSPGETRYEVNPATGQYEAIGGNATTGSYVPGADPNVDAWIKNVNSGGYKITDVPKQYQDQVSQGISQIPKASSAATKATLNLVDQLLGSNTNVITGIPGITSLIPGTEAQKTKNLYDQLKASLTLQNISQLKGTGAISDKEEEILTKASSALGTNLSNEDFKDVLTNLKNNLSQEGGQQTSTDAANSQVFATQW